MEMSLTKDSSSKSWTGCLVNIQVQGNIETNVDYTQMSLAVSLSYEWVQVNKSEIAARGYIQASIDQLLNGVSNKIR
jgi:hypothetical protein